MIDMRMKNASHQLLSKKASPMIRQIMIRMPIPQVMTVIPNLVFEKSLNFYIPILLI